VGIHRRVWLDLDALRRPVHVRRHGQRCFSYSYAYYPATDGCGWRRLDLGWGAYPYFGPRGPSGFGWYRGLYRSGYGWGGYHGGVRGGYGVAGGNRAGNGFGGGARGASVYRAGGGFRGSGGNTRAGGGFRGAVAGAARALAVDSAAVAAARVVGGHGGGHR